MTVAIYARVSSESQEARGTIGSQLEVLRLKMAELGQQVVHEYIDDGYSGARLDRPGLDALRDAAEAGVFKQLWCLTPDRLARSYAYQILITDELLRHGVQVHYLDAPPLDDDPEATLLVQVQGVIAEYERAKIAERNRRGRLFRARAGEIVYRLVPYGYRRIPRGPAGPCHLEIYEPEAVVGAPHLRRLRGRRLLDAAHLPPPLRGRRCQPDWQAGVVDRLPQQDAGESNLQRTRAVQPPPISAVDHWSEKPAHPSSDRPRSGSRSRCPPSSATISLMLHNGSPVITPTSARGALGPTTGSCVGWWCVGIVASRRIARADAPPPRANCATTCAIDGEHSRRVDLNGLPATLNSGGGA